MINEKLKNLTFDVIRRDTTKAVDYKPRLEGFSVLSQSHHYIYQGLSDKQEIEEFDNRTFLYLRRLIEFANQANVREYINIYQNSVILCNNLINEKEYDTEKEKNIFVTSDVDREQLFKLMGTVFDFQNNGEFFQAMRYIFEKRLQERELKNWTESTILYEKQEIQKLNKILPIIQKIQKERYVKYEYIADVKAQQN